MNGKPKLLIVDDVAENIHMLSNLLRDDFKIIAATNGEKAIELAQKTPRPDIIVLDIIMPGMDGYEVCKKLKDNIYTKNIPVVFITSLNDPDAIEKGFACGAAEFITKPIQNTLVKKRLLNQLNLDKKDNIEEEILSPETKDTILVVDDSAENIQVILEILKDYYQLIVANSGEKALQILETKKPDLILLDILMPHMDGFKVCEYIKSDKKTAFIPVIFLTVLEDEKDIVKGFELGAVDYISKPVEPSVLKARIKTHLKLKHYQDRLKQDIKQKEAMLIKQSKMAVLGEMFENITHQWKQPLSVVSLTSGNIRLKKELGTLHEEELTNSLENIENSIRYLNQTIDDFRSFLNNDVEKQYFKIKDLIDSSIKLIQSRYKNLNIDIQNNVENIEVLTHKNDLVQVLMNILSNAEDALRQKKGERHILISSSLDDNIITIKISDNGGGIDDSVKERIFDKYISTKDKSDNSGIGLYMSRIIIQERLKGTIKSYNENDGACFEINFPIK